MPNRSVSIPDRIDTAIRTLADHNYKGVYSHALKDVIKAGIEKLVSDAKARQNELLENLEGGYDVK